MRIASLHRYLVKGFSAEDLAEVLLAAGDGLPGDRRFAFALGRSGFDPAAPDWLPKRHFACLMLQAGVARVRSRFDAARGVLHLEADDTAPLAADLATDAGRAAAAAWVTDVLGEAAEGEIRLAEAPGRAFTDIPRKAVHIVGLASVTALAGRMGVALDARRFRANLVLADAAPFAELDWVGRDLGIGNVRLRVFDRTARCAATEVNLETAARDMKPQRALRDHYGHADMGVYAEVVAGGTIRTADTIALLPG